MSILQAILLGLIQGAAEFLPVSSSGHLVIVPWLLGWDSPTLTFDTVVHLGTLIAVIVYFRQDIISLLRAWWDSVRARKIETAQARLAWLLIAASVPGALLGYLLDDWFEQMFSAPAIAAALLLVTGVLLVTSERLGKRERSLDAMKWPDALWIGLAQALAIAPGLSRSGATISAGLFRGFERDEAARFSFLLGIPIIAGSAAFQLLKTASEISSGEALQLVLGFMAALISGYMFIHFLLNYVRTHSLRPFAYYCWAFGALALIVSLFR